MEEIKNRVLQLSATHHTEKWAGRKKAPRAALLQTGMYCITGVSKENTMKLRKLHSLNNSKARV